MDARIYLEMKQVEDVHWWFVGRRRIVHSVLADVLRSARLESPRILDAGCGTGGNLPMLATLGRVKGMEYEPVAADLARGRGPWQVSLGALPDRIPFGDERFDLVVMTDVLEHIDDDVGALRSLARLIDAGGHLVLTVPAFPFLWGPHDEQHHHKRRYTAATLRAAVAAAGLEIVRLSYFNFWLFPLVAAARLSARGRHQDAQTLLRVPPRPLNRMLSLLFGSERLWLRRAAMPFGVSLLAVLRARPA